jgi:diaminopimelate decarboxylase
VLRTLARHTDGFEVSSGGELAHTAAAAPGRPLAFGGPGKIPAELAAALELAAAPDGGTTRFHVKSPHELALLDQAARAAGRRADVLLRVNPRGQEEQAALVMGGKPSPFGMDFELLRRCTPVPPSVRLRGLHAHLASRVAADGLLAAAGRLLSAGRRWCAEQGDRAEFNLGGGMAVD